MRCGCPECGTYTVHVEKGFESYCLCPDCGWVCRDCMGGKNKKENPLTPEQARILKHLHDEADGKKP
jgi:hypothetical protein